MNLQQNIEKPSEAELRLVSQALFEAAAEGLVVVDQEGQIILVNHRMSEMFGYGEDELVGSKIEKLVPSRFAGGHEKLRAEFTKCPTRRSMGEGMDLSARCKDGSEFPVEISLNHFEMNGRRYVMALISDITKRKVTELELEKLNQELELRVQERTRELAESQHLYSVIARNFPNGIIMVFNRRFDYVFAEGKELFKMGVTSDELVGTNYLDRLDEGVREKIKDKLLEVFDGRNVSFEVIVDDKCYELNAVSLRDSDGIISRSLVVETNVTQQIRA